MVIIGFREGVGGFVFAASAEQNRKIANVDAI